MKYSGVLTGHQGAGLVAWDVSTGEPAKVLNLELTAAAMLKRSTKRRANGRYKRKAHKAQIVGVAVTAFVFLSCKLWVSQSCGVFRETYFQSPQFTHSYFVIVIGAGISIISPSGGVAISVGQWSGLAVIIAVFAILLFVIKVGNVM